MSPAVPTAPVPFVPTITVWMCGLCRDMVSAGTQEPTRCTSCNGNDGSYGHDDGFTPLPVPVINEPEPPPSDAVEVLQRMAASDDVRTRARGVISTWLIAQLPGGGIGLSRNRTADKALAQAIDLIKTMTEADLWTVLAPDFRNFIDSIREAANTRAQSRAQAEHEVQAGVPGQRGEADR